MKQRRDRIAVVRSGQRLENLVRVLEPSQMMKSQAAVQGDRKPQGRRCLRLERSELRQRRPRVAVTHEGYGTFETFGRSERKWFWIRNGGETSPDGDRVTSLGSAGTADGDEPCSVEYAGEITDSESRLDF